MPVSESSVIVGLTGQTGAGKSTVSKIFRENGFAVIDADLTARKVVEPKTKCLEEIAEIFGSEILNADGTLDRRKLAGIVFSDKSKLEVLNATIYPYITDEILKLINNYSEKGEKFILLDAPTLFESGASDFCDIIISVLADAETRKQRIIKRDGLTPQQAENRMNSQHDDKFFTEHSDYIIKNNGSIDSVSEMTEEISDKIKNCCYRY